MKYLCAALCLIALGSTACAGAPPARVKVGDPLPAFTAKTLAGHEIAPAALKGKVVLINFFATWCGPCLAEMPRLQKEIFARHQRDDFLLLAIGREHSAAELAAFRAKHGFPFPLVPDPEREIFALFADAFIPRNIVVGRDGAITYASAGYFPDKFQELVDAVARELGPVAKK